MVLFENVPARATFRVAFLSEIDEAERHSGDRSENRDLLFSHFEERTQHDQRVHCHRLNRKHRSQATALRA
jgi:hypothetical protein